MYLFFDRRVILIKISAPCNMVEEKIKTCVGKEFCVFSADIAGVPCLARKSYPKDTELQYHKNEIVRTIGKCFVGHCEYQTDKTEKLQRRKEELMEAQDAKKNLCAMIPADLHAKVMEEKEKLELKTLGEYIEQILKEHFEGGKTSMAGTKTLAFQVSEELLQRLKDYLEAEQKRTGRKISQKEFVVGLIEAALADAEDN